LRREFSLEFLMMTITIPAHRAKAVSKLAKGAGFIFKAVDS